MAEEIPRVGARQFREGLAQYLDSSTPIAITRHGETVGYYLPTRREAADHERPAFERPLTFHRPDGTLEYYSPPRRKNVEQEWKALRKTVEEIEAWLKEAGITEDEIVAEFDALRRADLHRAEHDARRPADG